MKQTLTQELRNMGCSKTQIHKYLQRLNRSGLYARDIKFVSVRENELYFFSNRWDEMIIAFQR